MMCYRLHDVRTVPVVTRHSLGEVRVPFCLQSVSKPLAYGLALDELGCNSFHEYVGQEPSGITFNAIALDPTGKYRCYCYDTHR